jgi:hypothetical protein
MVADDGRSWLDLPAPYVFLFFFFGRNRFIPHFTKEFGICLYFLRLEKKLYFVQRNATMKAFQIYETTVFLSI